jgi:diguanylate cyclase (GGDEF)-like protein
MSFLEIIGAILTLDGSFKISFCTADVCTNHDSARRSNRTRQSEIRCEIDKMLVTGGTIPGRCASSQSVGCCVLIVDDDPDLLLGITNRLHGKFKVQTATGAEAAMTRLAADTTIAVVVSDLRMPGTDGIALLSRICEEMPDVVRILLTGHADLNVAAHAINACGVFRLLLKPSRAGELELAIEEALAHHTLNRRAKSLALEDFLLGIGNRRAFEHGLLRTHMQATRYHRAYGLAMMDVDHFKHYNDTYGHMAGDCALEAIAKVLRSTCRGSDEAFRYGGEEIVLLLPDTPKQGLLVACERFRRQVENLCITHQDHEPPHVTVSIGASSCDGDPAVASTDILHQADLALYQSKATGRNRVTLWQAGQPGP